MSFDLQLAWPCPHLTVDEPVTLAADRRRLITQRPVAGTGALSLRANDRFLVGPAVGLSVAAAVTGERGGPFIFTRDTAELTVTTPAGAVEVRWAAGYQTSAQVAERLTAAARGSFEVTVEASGALTLEDRAGPSGPGSRIALAGPARAALGFARQWGGAGRRWVPAWGVAALEGTGPGAEGGYQVVFTEPVMAAPRFTLTYSVEPELCFRCRGTGVENDIRYDSRGAVRTVSGYDLLYQSCLKIILTELGSNPNYLWYGSALAGRIGAKSGPGTRAAISASVRKALENLQALQTVQSKYQLVAAAERLYAIDRIDVDVDPRDPTVYYVTAAVRSYSSEPVELTVVYSVPGTFALAGTNGLALGNPG